MSITAPDLPQRSTVRDRGRHFSGAFILAALLSAGASLARADAAVRPDSLIFNQTYALVAGTTTVNPLYLTRRGEYYAEAILERADGSERSLDVGFELNVRIERDDNALFERGVSSALGRERPAATLFWLTSDRELPLKRRLDLVVRVDAVGARADGETVRIQIKRKLNRGRLR